MYEQLRDNVKKMLDGAKITVAQIAIVPDDTHFSILRPDFT